MPDLGDELGARRGRGVGVAVRRGRGPRLGPAHLHLHLRHARKPADDPRGHAVQRDLRLRRLGGEGQGEGHAGVRDFQFLHEPERDDVLLLLGVSDAAQGVENGLFVDHTGRL